MVILMVALTVVIIMVVDLALRLMLKRIEQGKIRKERQRALDIGLRLEFADEAKSLKRVEVPSPKARILAVDDEPVILDSFRKILVLAGFSVDTVETGPEALGLVRKNDYQFVFTDLKMPGMDGLDVTKAVKHLRPDIDIAIITGYGTIESAVSGMKYGAVDYVEKPFTEDELIEFANRLLIRRQDRLARLTAPEIHLVTPSSGALASARVINVPGGIYVSPEHTWISVEITGEGLIGLDDLVHKTVGKPESIRLPEQGQQVRKGQALFAIRRGERSLTFRSPLSGRVSKVNHELEFNPALMRLRPYDQGWICVIEPNNLTGDLSGMTLGADSVAWYQTQVESFRRKLAEEMAANRPPDKAHTAGTGENADAAWNAFASCFLGPEAGLAPGPVGTAP
ncbi:MAG: response regulator [Candidatus Binatia bacterium]